MNYCNYISETVLFSFQCREILKRVQDDNLMIALLRFQKETQFTPTLHRVIPMQIGISGHGIFLQKIRVPKFPFSK